MKRFAISLLIIVITGVIIFGTGFSMFQLIEGCTHVFNDHTLLLEIVATAACFTGGLAGGVFYPPVKKPYLTALICSPGIWYSLFFMFVSEFESLAPLTLIPASWIGYLMGIRITLRKAYAIVFAQIVLVTTCFVGYDILRVNITKLAYMSGKEINESDEKGRTLLMDECMGIGSPRVIAALVKLGVDVNQKDVYGNTALHFACSHNPNIDAVRKLIELNARVDERDNDGETALFSAARHGYYEIADLLIQHGLSVNAKNRDGRTPLMYACSSSKSARTAETLIHHGADVNTKDNSGDTSLILAVDNYQEKKGIVDLLIEHGADINAGNTNGVTPFAQAVLSMQDYGLEAVKTGQEPIIAQLARLGANVNAKPYGTPLLFFFIDTGEVDKIALLLDLGADINATDNKGRTALISIMSRISDCGPFVHPSTIRYLLENGIDPSAVDSSGKSAIDHLKERVDFGID